MPLSVFIEMTLSAILTVWSPGPNNILLLSTASKYGISGNIRFMTGNAVFAGCGQQKNIIGTRRPDGKDGRQGHFYEDR